MPIDLNWQPKGVEWVCTGDITYEEVMEADAMMFGDPRFSQADYLLVNCLAADSVKMTELEMRINVTQDAINAVHKDYLKIAIVVADPKLESLADFYAQQLKDKHVHWEVDSFSNIEDARVWIGV